MLRGELHRAVGARGLRCPDEDPLIPPRVLVSVLALLLDREPPRELGIDLNGDLFLGEGGVSSGCKPALRMISPWPYM